MKHQNYDQIPDVNAASIFLFIRPFPTFIKAGLVFEKSGVGFTVKVVRLISEDLSLSLCHAILNVTPGV